MAFIDPNAVRDPRLARRDIAHQLEVILLDKAPVPWMLSVNGRAVPIFDLQGAISAFRDQTELLRRFDSAWPAVSLQFGRGSALGEAWAPLDLRNIDPDIRQDRLEKSLAFRSLHGPLINAAKQSGLDARERGRDEIVQCFGNLLADVIHTRAAGLAQPSAFEPPSAAVTVTSAQARDKILCSPCYFINMWSEFGAAATAPLFWGHYIFGVERNGRPIFSGTVQSVPAISFVDLDL
jgi:hypothetical protein